MGTLWTLSEIRSKVRGLTGRPSTNQLTNNDLDDYINHFYTEDMLAILELDENQGRHIFHTQANVDEYTNIPQSYLISEDFNINGNALKVYRDPKLFDTDYPRDFATGETVGTGDGSTNPITGTLNKSPVNPDYVTFDDGTETFTVDNDLEISNITNADPAVVTTKVNHPFVTGDKVQIKIVYLPDGYAPDEGDKKGMQEINDTVTTITKLTDTTFELDNIDSSSFSEYVSGGVVSSLSVARLSGDMGGSGSLTLSSGVFSLSSNTTVTDGQAVKANYEAYTAGMPDAVLVYGREFRMRPIPDGVYKIEAYATLRPQPFQATTDVPMQNDWGKFIAYGAAIDILRDSGQVDSADRLEAQFERLRGQIEVKRIKNHEGDRAIPRF